MRNVFLGIPPSDSQGTPRLHSPLLSSVQWQNSFSPSGFWGRIPQWTPGQPTPSLDSEMSPEPGVAGWNEGKQLSQISAKDNCSRASLWDRLIFMLYVKRLRQLFHSETLRPAHRLPALGSENGLLTGSK